MRRLTMSAIAAAGIYFTPGLWPALSLGIAELPAHAACDEADPAGPARSARVTLGASDRVEENGDKLRTFVETGSLGRVSVAMRSASPRDAVISVAAVPEVSRYSQLNGEHLEGVAVTVWFENRRRPPVVTLDLRQVCAKYFHNSYLYE